MTLSPCRGPVVAGVGSEDELVETTHTTSTPHSPQCLARPSALSDEETGPASPSLSVSAGQLLVSTPVITLTREFVEHDYAKVPDIGDMNGNAAEHAYGRVADPEADMTRPFGGRGGLFRLDQ